MRASVIAAAAALSLCVVQPVAAQEAQDAQEGQDAAEAESSEPLPVIRTTDTALTCVQISDEAAQLSEAMGGDPEGGLFSRLGGVAKAGAAMVIPGAGLVTAAADALTQPGRQREEARERAVQNRWYYLNGLYAGQRCQARAEAVLSGTPVPAPAATPTAATASTSMTPAAAPAATPAVAAAMPARATPAPAAPATTAPATSPR